MMVVVPDLVVVDTSDTVELAVDVGVLYRSILLFVLLFVSVALNEFKRFVRFEVLFESVSVDDIDGT